MIIQVLERKLQIRKNTIRNEQSLATKPILTLVSCLNLHYRKKINI